MREEDERRGRVGQWAKKRSCVLERFVRWSQPVSSTPAAHCRTPPTTPTPTVGPRARRAAARAGAVGRRHPALGRARARAGAAADGGAAAAGGGGQRRCQWRRQRRRDGARGGADRRRGGRGGRGGGDGDDDGGRRQRRRELRGVIWCGGGGALFFTVGALAHPAAASFLPPYALSSPPSSSLFLCMFHTSRQAASIRRDRTNKVAMKAPPCSLPCTPFINL